MVSRVGACVTATAIRGVELPAACIRTGACRTAIC